MVYVFSASPFFTFTVTTFSPSFHVAEPSFSISVLFTVIVISASASSGVAVILLLAFVVLAVYAVTELSNSGSSVSEPIVSPDKFAVKGLYR